MSSQPRRCPRCLRAMPLTRRKCPYCRSDLPVGEETRSLEAIFLQEKLSTHFEIIETISHKGITSTFLAHDLILEHKVVLKALNLGEVKDKELYKRWKQNVKRSIRLDHPNVVRNYTYGLAGPLHYFIVEYVSEQTLNEYLKERKILPVWEALRIARDIARGLQAAHNLEICHHRVHPNNITRSFSGFARVMDFGSSHAVMDALENQPWSPDSEAIEYMAPERIELGISDPATDQYAVGIILFSMLTGTLPFSGNGEEAAIQRIKEQPPCVREFNQDIPHKLELIINQILSPNPEYRYATCDDLAVALESLEPEIWMPSLSPHPEHKETEFAINDYLEEAQRAEEERDFRKAILLCEQALVLSPYDTHVTDSLARLKQKSERLDEVNILINKGLSAFYEGRLDIAMTVLNKAKRIDKNNPKILRITHEVLQEQERHRLTNVLLKAAKIDYKQKDLTQSMAKVVKILDIDPGNQNAQDLKQILESAMEDKATVSLLVSRAEEAFRRRDYKKTEKLISEIFSLDENNKSARKLEANVEEWQRREKILKLKALLEKQLRNIDYDQAMETLETISELDPTLSDEIQEKIAQIKSCLDAQKFAQEAKTYNASKTQIIDNLATSENSEEKTKKLVNKSPSPNKSIAESAPMTEATQIGRSDNEIEIDHATPEESIEKECFESVPIEEESNKDAAYDLIAVDDLSLVPDRSNSQWRLRLLAILGGSLVVFFSILLIFKWTSSSDHKSNQKTMTPAAILPAVIDIPTPTSRPTNTFPPRNTSTPKPLSTFTPITKSGQIQAYLDAAKKYERAGNLNAARENYRSVLKLKRTHLEAQGALARINRELDFKSQSNLNVQSKKTPISPFKPVRQATKTPFSYPTPTSIQSIQLEPTSLPPSTITPLPTLTPRPKNTSTPKQTRYKLNFNKLTLNPNPPISGKKLKIKIYFDDLYKNQIKGIWFNYRYPKDRAYIQIRAEKTRTCFRVELSGKDVRGSLLEYYILAIDKNGREMTYGLPSIPKEIKISDEAFIHVVPL